MTKEKAKSYLKHMLEMMATEPPENLVDERDIREWEDEHSKIRDTLEVSLSAIEKQIPKKPRKRQLRNINGDVIDTSYYCPICDEYFREEFDEYCPTCGQAVDWEEGGTSD